MTRGGWVGWVAALVIALPSGWSESPPTPEQTNLRSVAAAPRVSAAVNAVERGYPGDDIGVVKISFGPGVSKSQRMKANLKSAYLTAVDRLYRDSRCGALFAPLGADGVEMLERSVYARANAGMEATWCRHAVAGTSVGKKMVFLCRRFASIPVEEAATILIHEALHRAGMSESPLDRGCMTGDEISEMVRRECFPRDDAEPVTVASIEPERTERADPGGPVRTVPSVVQAARTSSVAMPLTTSRVTDIVEMRSFLPY